MTGLAAVAIGLVAIFAGKYMKKMTAKMEEKRKADVEKKKKEKEKKGIID